MPESRQYARIVMSTAGVWRADRLAAAIHALDGLSCRVAAASYLAQKLQDHEYVISNLRVLGLLDKGTPKHWGEADGSTESLARSDYLKLTTMLRNNGINVVETDVSWSLQFAFDDILEIVPRINRLEVESIRLCSPGFLSFLLSGDHAKPGLTGLLTHIFNSVFWHEETKRAMDAMATKLEAEAMQELTKALCKTPSRDGRDSQVPEGDSLQIDYEKSIDTLEVSLRNAAIVPKDIREAIMKPVDADLNVLCQLKCQGMIRGIAVGFVAEEIRPDKPGPSEATDTED